MEGDPAISLANSYQQLSYQQLQSLTDEQIVDCLRMGQADALAVLFDRYQKLVLSIAKRIVRDDGEAEDVTQTVFLDIYKAVAQFDPTLGSTRVWLMQYAYHRAINRKQHLEVRKFYNSSDLEAAEPVERHLSRFAGLSHPEAKQLVSEAMAQLSSGQRRAIEFATFDGLTMAEIAERTGETVDVVRHHYYRGLKKLRQMISGR